MMKGENEFSAVSDQTVKECVFCRIIRNEAEAAIVYENEEHVCIMDRYPIAKGHMLVMPRKHYPDLFTMPLSEAGRMFTLAADLGCVVVKTLKADGLNIGQNNGAAANQIIFHVHIHVIPRYKDDVTRGSWPSRRQMSLSELEETAMSIKMSIKGISSE